MRKFWALIVIISVILIAIGAVLFFLVNPGANTAVPAKTPVLATALWGAYLHNQWLSEGRTVSDPSSSVTTSEAQAYTLLRAVWQNDKPVFATTWEWTKNNLGRSDGLFSWRWGRNPNGSYGIVTADNGQNTASDADCDIALALLMAGHRWNNPAYINYGVMIAKAIWKTEVVKVNGLYYLAADNIEKNATAASIVVNPSYFAPYSYRIFAIVDTANPWTKLANDSYVELERICSAKLGSKSTDNLPPDWALVNRTSGKLTASSNPAQDTNFGFNAFRVVWRTALDWQWNHNQAAIQLLQRFGFLFEQWQSKHKLLAIYDRAGKPASDYSSLAMYGGTLGYFQYIHPGVARQITLNQLIGPLLNTSGNLKQPINYYDNNWAWFGLSLYNKSLPNLAGGRS